VVIFGFSSLDIFLIRAIIAHKLKSFGPKNTFFINIKEERMIKKVVYNFIMVMAMFGLLIFTGCKSSSQQPNPGQNPPAPDDESEFTIYYALNESHSASWVRQSAQGVVGIVYGVFGQGTAIQDGRNPGSLVYKTIMPDGSENEEVVTTDRGVDKSVLLYDSNSFPHIFYARSDNSDQAILHVYQNGGTGWTKETVINFANEGGRFIYELSADIDKNDSIHLLVLKTRSNPDSSDFSTRMRTATSTILPMAPGIGKRH
jgi:hypothetical protein